MAGDPSCGCPALPWALRLAHLLCWPCRCMRPTGGRCCRRGRCHSRPACGWRLPPAPCCPWLQPAGSCGSMAKRAWRRQSACWRQSWLHSNSSSDIRAHRTCSSRALGALASCLVLPRAHHVSHRPAPNITHAPSTKGSGLPALHQVQPFQRNLTGRALVVPPPPAGCRGLSPVAMPPLPAVHLTAGLAPPAPQRPTASAPALRACPSWGARAPGLGKGPEEGGSAAAAAAAVVHTQAAG